MNQQQTIRFTWGIFALALIAYILPWTVNTGNSLSMGAYDFAEWLSKRPIDTISYNAIFLLRGQLVLLTWFIMLSTERPHFRLRWWLHIVIGIILVIAQLPPIEFIRNTSDINQQQQAILAIVSLIAIPIGASSYLARYRNIIWIIIALIGLATTLFALTNAINIARNYQIPNEIGVGAIIFSLGYGFLGIVAARELFLAKS
jgi:hypothetical protein